MSKQSKPGKNTVELHGAARPSRIRRDPPRPEKKTLVPDRGELDRRTVAIGIVAFALVIVVIVIAFGSWAGWSPSQYTIHVRLD